MTTCRRHGFRSRHSGCLAAGSVAAALGSAFLTCHEAGTNRAHRQALLSDAPTVLARAFTERLARGIRNTFIDNFESLAPVAYPEIHHVTAPLREAGPERDDPDPINLWAGQAHSLCQEASAALISRLWNETLTELHRLSAAGNTVESAA